MRNWVKVFFLLLAFSEDLLASPISLDHGKPVSLLTRNFDSDKSVLVMLGELAFKSETLLSPSRSFAIPLSCDSCHPDGGTTQILFVEGLSGKPGTIDITNRKIDLEIHEDEIKRRQANLNHPSPRYSRGVLAKYARTVSSASLGAVTDLN